MATSGPPARTPRELAEIALEVAREAGKLVQRGWRKNPSAIEKARSDLVTQYDFESERLIRALLAERTPELALVAEEHGGDAREGPTWYCDPLDGTTNFVHGHHFWAVSIGALAHGVPIAGAVVAPSLRSEWMGYQAGTAARDGLVCSVSETERLDMALVATGFPTERTKEPWNNFETFVRVKKAVRGVRRCGSAAIDMCLVADGTYDGYWERHVHAWDLAGGAAVLLSAGGRLSALDGGRAELAKGHVLATNGRIHDALLCLM
jgi:myo-inositol-1(or 4)-monophosphatase